MLGASPTFAFYNADVQSKGPIFQKERCYVVWDKGERAFALYDNLNCPLDKLGKGSVICPRSDEFVPADVFRGNIPLRPIFVFGDVHKIITFSINSRFFKRLRDRSGAGPLR